jgi:response regulator of citrate/malate metabolism
VSRSLVHRSAFWLTPERFELARLQLGFLVHSHTVEEINTALKHFREHRESLSSSEQDNSVKSRVTKLYDYAYEKTMEMIKTMPGAYPELAMKALAWILYGPANFTSDELLHALAIEISKTSSGTYRAVLKNELYDL